MNAQPHVGRPEHTPKRYDPTVTARATPATELLRRSGTPHRIHEYRPAQRHGRERDARPDYGHEAAAALGVDPARVCKTLVVAVDGRLAMAVLPVDRQLDLRAVAAALGARHAELAEPIAAERAAGSVVGGISPIAPRRPLPTVADGSIEAHATIFVSAGRRGVQIELAPQDMVRSCTAIVARITRST